MPSGAMLHEDHLREFTMKALLVIVSVAFVGYFAIGTGFSAEKMITNHTSQIEKILEEAK